MNFVGRTTVVNHRAVVERTFEDFDGERVPVTTITPTPLYMAEEFIRGLTAQRDFYQRNVDRYTQEIIDLMVDRDGTYPSHEQDRKTRHVRYIERQREEEKVNVKFYNDQIIAAQAALPTLLTTSKRLNSGVVDTEAQGADTQVSTEK